MTAMSNGRAQRKSLAGEIDRLDDILDGLDAALAGSVEAAVRDVVGQAVRQAVDAALREALGRYDHPRPGAPAAPPTPARSAPAPLRQRLGGVVAALRQAAGDLRRKA